MTATQYLVIADDGQMSGSMNRTLEQVAQSIYEGQHGFVVRVLEIVLPQSIWSWTGEIANASEQVAQAILQEHPELATSDDLRDVNVIQFIEASIPGWFARTAA